MPASAIVGAPSAEGTPAGAWRVLWLISFAVVCSLTTWFSTTAVALELTMRWGLSTAQSAWLTNGVQIGFVTGAVVSSLLNISDIVSARRLMAVSALIAAAANLLLLTEPGLAAAVLLRVVTGAALAGVYPPALKLISSWFRRGRGLALGIVIGALTLGSSMPHLFNALYGHVPWRAVIFGASCLTCVGAGIFALAAKVGPFGAAAARFDPSQSGQVFRNRPLMLVNLGYFGHMWELYAMWGWFLVFANTAIVSGMPDLGGKASLITFAVVASGAAGCLIGGAFADRIGRTATTILMMAASAAAAVAIGFAFDGPSWLFLAVSVIWGVTVVGDSAQFSASATELADPDYVGTALTLQLGIGFALTVVSIWLTPLFAAWMGGWQWAFLLLVPGPVMGIAAMLALRGRPESRRLADGRR